MTLVQINDMRWRSGSCPVPGQGRAGWYAESRLSVTADILREAVRDYKNSLPSLSPFLPLLSRAKSGSVCYYGIQKGGRPSSDTLTYSRARAFVHGLQPHPDSNHISCPPFILTISAGSISPGNSDCAPRGHVFGFNPGFGTLA